MTTLIPKFDLKNGTLLPDGAVNRPIQDKLSETISFKDFGGVGDGATDNTASLQKAVDYCIANGRNLYIPAGTYLVSGTIYFVDDYSPDYPFPRLKQFTIYGEGGSVIKTSQTTGTLFYLGNPATPSYMKGSLYLVDITLDGGNHEITLVNAVSSFQSRFYAEKCNFVGVTGIGSYALNMDNSSAWLKDCVIQGSGADYTTNGVGITARVTEIKMENCFVSYFSTGILVRNFAESQIQAYNCLFQINNSSLRYEGGGYINNTSAFYGCGFVENKPGDIIVTVADQTTFGSIGNLSFYSCEFDGYNSNAATPVLNFNFTNCGGNITLIGCNVYTATAPSGTTALTNVTIGQYSSVEFNNCTGFTVISNNNPAYAKFADWEANGTPGGASSAGNNTRKINTTVYNNISSCSIGSNQVTLPEGVYSVSASAPCYQGGAHSLSLYNVTDSAYLIYGTNEYASIAGDGQTRSQISGRIVITKTTVISLLHYITSAKATNGLGLPVSDGDPEVYAQIEIWKEA